MKKRDYDNYNNGIDLGISNLDLGLGGFDLGLTSKKPFRVDLGFGPNYSGRGGIVDDMRGFADDLQTDARAFRQVKEDVSPVVRKGFKGIQRSVKKVLPKQFTIYTSLEGVIVPHNFKTYQSAMEFRQRSIASGRYDAVSDIPKINPNI